MSFPDYLDWLILFRPPLLIVQTRETKLGIEIFIDKLTSEDMEGRGQKARTIDPKIIVLLTIFSKAIDNSINCQTK